MSRTPCILAWSGGKDSALALERILSGEEHEVKALLTTLHGPGHRISMHGVREALLDEQAERMGIPMHKLKLSEGGGEEYEREMERMLRSFKEEGIEHVVFGDIFLEDLREYRERQLERVGMKGVFPLWKEDTSELLQEAYDSGIRTVLCCCREGTIGTEHLGKLLTPELVASFSEGVDPCGEYGEFHSFVVDAPFFERPIEVQSGEQVERSFPDPEGEGEVRFFYLDLI